jgi:hypothetical protein
MQQSKQVSKYNLQHLQIFSLSWGKEAYGAVDLPVR